MSDMVAARDLNRIGQWVLDTCLAFGASFETAAHVAGHFVEGLRREWEKASDE